MKPRTAADCLAAIDTPLTLAEYNEAIARIEQLVAAERAIAAHEMDEAHARKAASAAHQKEIGQ